MTTILLSVFFLLLWQASRAGWLSFAGGGKQAAKNRVLLYGGGVALILSFLPVFLLPSLIVGTGGDYWNYYKMFFQVANGGTVETEPGFQIICKIIQLFSDNPQWIFVIFNLASYLLFYRGLITYRESPAIGLVMLYCTQLYFLGIPQIRQQLAIMLVFIAYRYIAEGKFFPVILLTLLAMLFHKTAVLLLPLYFLLRRQIRLTDLLVMSGFLVAAYLFSDKILALIIKVLYSQYKDVDSFNVSRGINIWQMLLVVPSAAVLMMYHRRIDQNNMKERVFTNAIIYYILFNLFCFWVPDLYRLIAYLNIANVVAIPMLLNKEKKYNVRYLILTGLIVFYGIIIYFRLWVNQTFILFPYVNIFNWMSSVS